MNREEIHHLASLFGSYPRNSGDNVMMSCPNSRFSPLHNFGPDKKPSFGVKVNEMGFSSCHCFTCGLSGSLHVVMAYLYKLRRIEKAIVDYVSNLEKGNPNVWMDRLLHKKNSRWEDGDNRIPRVDFSKVHHKCSNNRMADGYFRRRGLHTDEISRFGLGYDTEKECLYFPIISRKEEVVGAIGRNTNEKVKSGKPKYFFYEDTNKEYLYGENRINPSTDRDLVLVEGPLDALFSFRCFPNVLALGGLNLTEVQIERILHFCDSVTLIMDGDPAGIAGIHRVGNSLHRRVRTYVVELPKDKDPASISREELSGLYNSRLIF